MLKEVEITVPSSAMFIVSLAAFRVDLLLALPASRLVANSGLTLQRDIGTINKAPNEELSDFAETAGMEVEEPGPRWTGALQSTAARIKDFCVIYRLKVTSWNRSKAVARAGSDAAVTSETTAKR
jgi:hypothetical protein